METRIITGPDALEALCPDWRRLGGAAARQDVFQALPWVRHWYRNFGKPHPLCVVAVTENHRAVGILPMVRDGDSAKFAGFSASDYNALLCETGREAEVLPACLHGLFRRTGVTRVLLENVPEASPPGQVLLYYLLDYCREAPVEEFDFGPGGESHKYRFSNEVMQSVHIAVCRPGWEASRAYLLQPVRKWKRQVIQAEELQRPLDYARELDAVRQAAGAGTAWRKALADRVYATERIAVWRRPAVAEPAGSAHHGFQVESATLSTLADEVVLHGDWVPGPLLQDARPRLKQRGKQCPVRWQESLAAIFWMHSAQRFFPRLWCSASCREARWWPVNSTASTMRSKRWPPPVHGLAAETARRGVALWVAVPAAVNGGGLAALGFEPHSRVRRVVRWEKVRWTK